MSKCHIRAFLECRSGRIYRGFDADIRVRSGVILPNGVVFETNRAILIVLNVGWILVGMRLGLCCFLIVHIMSVKTFSCIQYETSSSKEGQANISILLYCCI